MQTPRSLGVALVAVAVACCGPAGRSDSSDTPDAALAACYDPGLTGTVVPGTANIQACAIWNSLALMTGDVTVTRTATILTMSFASGVDYTGTVIGDNVILTYATTHSFTDGCSWRATETLTGTLDPRTCVMTLSYQYAESVDNTNGNTCATPCTGTDNFSLQITPIE
jgi:hypothetical protein